MNPALALPEMPSFAEFATLRRELATSGSVVVDFTETRLAKALGPMLRSPGSFDLPSQGHRCHVAEHWLECFGLPSTWRRRALVTQGVRHSLECLFKLWATQGLRVLVPGDVYPVYLELARNAHCRVETYATFPRAQFEGLESTDVVLVTNPVKTRGGELDAREQADLHRWLRGGCQRRVVIDAVYLFDTRLSDATTALYATEQAIVLHSLSKGWASPLLAGVALVPPSDVDMLTSTVKELDIDRNGLRLAQALLDQDCTRPFVLRERLTGLASTLQTSLSEFGLSTPLNRDPSSGEGQYLFVLEQSWREVFGQHGILTLPLSVFGSELPGHSVASSLPASPAR